MPKIGDFEKLSKSCELSWCDGNCHWVIMRDDKQAIFQYPVSSKQEARGIISQHNLSGYHIAHMKTHGSSH